MKKKKIAKYIQETETPIKPKVLYDKVTWGGLLTENEKTFLRNVLENESHSKDEGLGIAIEAFALSHTATRENITLVEKFLDKDFHNGIFAGTALKVLCYDYYWNLAKDYLSLLKGILLRQESDEELFSRAAFFKIIKLTDKRFWKFEAVMLLCGVATVCVEALNYGISLFYLIGQLLIYPLSFCIGGVATWKVSKAGKVWQLIRYSILFSFITYNLFAIALHPIFGIPFASSAYLSSVGSFALFSVLPVMICCYAYRWMEK